MIHPSKPYRGLGIVLRALWGYPVFVCGILLMYPVITICALIVGRGGYRQRFLCACGRVYFWLARIAFGVRLRVVGQPPTSGVVLACNHQSMIDALALCYASPSTLFLFRDSLHVAPLLRRLGMIPVRNNKHWLMDCCKVEMDYNIGIFPEGARIKHGVIVPYKRGVIAIASTTARPIYLACIDSGRYWGQRLIPAPSALCTTITLQFLEEVPHDTPLDTIEAKIRKGMDEQRYQHA
jgi:1-acyl-sn-glycerol-3-phosphate acyltransferase